MTPARVETELREIRSHMADITPRNPALHGWKSYAQCDEDGIIRECLDRISRTAALSRTLIEIGCGDGIENNTHQLLLDGFSGCWIDGDPEKISSIDTALGGLRFSDLWVRESLVSTDNVIQVTSDACDFLGGYDLDFLSIDIDGNDSHIARRMLDVVNPKLICVEYNAKFRPPTTLEIKCDPSFGWDKDDYFGASLQTWVNLLNGYKLVACNLSGVNAFFVRDDLTSDFTSEPIEQLFQPPRYWLTESPSGHPASLRWLRQRLEGTNLDPARIITVTAPVVGRFDFEVHEVFDQYISGDIVRDHVWEPFESELFSRICRPADTVLDIGANIGWYTVLFSHLVGPDGTVLAFEPDSRNLEILRRNVARSGGPADVSVYPIGVGAHDAPGRLYMSGSNMGDHRLYHGDGLDGGHDIEVRSLDNLLRDTDRLPAVVKSDTQGFEGRVLEGSTELLDAGWRPVWLLEFWPYGLAGAGSDAQSLFEKMLDMDYSLFEVHELNPQLVPLTRSRLEMRMATDISVEAMGFINILAFPAGSDRLASVTDLLIET